MASELNEKMTAIADAIREKTGETEPLTLDDMATDIPKVFDAGKKAQLLAFWGPFQNYGEKMSYNSSFRHNGWGNDGAYDPQYTMNADIFAGVFNSSPVIDAKVPIDVTDGALNEAFRYGKIQRVPKLIVNENTTYDNPFRYASSLREMYVEGVIASDFDLSYVSNSFTADSMKSVINALKDFSGTEFDGVYTVSFKAACWTTLENDSTPKDEGIDFDGTWQAYVQSKGWQI